MAEPRESGATMSDNSSQESASLKAEWLKEVEHRLPIGTTVRVATSCVPSYIGVKGRVVEYATGGAVEIPFVRVKLEIGITAAFYTEEIERAICAGCPNPVSGTRFCDECYDDMVFTGPRV